METVNWCQLGRDVPLTLGSVSVELSRGGVSDILILLTLKGEFPSCVQWLICGHQWCMDEFYCPGTDTGGSLL